MLTETKRRGNLFVISGPSGAGKGTLVARLREKLPNIWVSVSATTRPPRHGEVDGVDYFFIGEHQFDDLLAEDGFLEWATVHRTYRYGTPRKAIEERIERGMQVILEIDPQGAFQVKERFPKAILIFIEPPSFEELERRLRGRGTESEEAVQARLETSKVELSLVGEYDVVVLNDDVSSATSELVDVIESYAKVKEA